MNSESNCLEYKHQLTSPKFELFQDRLEITSAGRIPEGFTEEEFFLGYSVPPNKIFMRIYKDLDIVEHPGSGIPRILEKYDPSIYHFTANFILVVFPFAEGYADSTPQATPQASDQDSDQATDQAEKILLFCKEPHNRDEIQSFLGLKDREYFRKEILKPLITAGKLELTIPDKPTSPNQKYVTIQILDKEK
jgi:predicted HTH transcriptional regulator